MKKNTIKIIPFIGEKENFICGQEFTARVVIKGSDVLLRGDMKKPGGIWRWNKQQGGYSYIQYDQKDRIQWGDPFSRRHSMFPDCIRIKNKANTYGESRQTWMELLRKIDPIGGASRIGLRKKFSKCKLDEMKR